MANEMKTCECPARAALEAAIPNVHWAFRQSMRDALAAPCPCAGLRGMLAGNPLTLPYGVALKFIADERDSLRAELATAKADADRWRKAATAFWPKRRG